MILKINSVDSLEITELESYRTLKRPLDHRRKGIFIAEGEKVVRRLFQSTINIISILLTPEWLEVYRDLLVTRNEGIMVYVGEKKILESIVGHELHLGIMALATVPPPLTVDELINKAGSPRCIVALDGITNAENLGLIIRNCAAFGVQGIIVGETSADPFLRRAVRNSMGNIFSLPVRYSGNLQEDIEQLQRQYDTLCFAAHPRTNSLPVSEIDLSHDCCIVLGAEGTGIRDHIAAACASAFAIPMKEGIDSLNVANASAVILYEVNRQRLRLL